MSAVIKVSLKALAALLLALAITFVFPKNQGSIDLALHDTYFVFSPWVFVCILWILLTIILSVGEFLFKRLKTLVL
jgi:hypothetical protein